MAEHFILGALTASQKVMHLILLTEVGADTIAESELDGITADSIDVAFARIDAELALHDAIYEFSEGTVETDIPAPSDRNYEGKSVAAQYGDGSWVGWTHWYGGGKHGSPETIDWIDDAYDLTCVEEEKLVTVRTFTKLEAPHG